MIGFIFILMLVILVVVDITARIAMQDKPVEEIVEVWCPPHKWKNVEVKDKDGNVLKNKLVCDLCGPLKPAE